MGKDYSGPAGSSGTMRAPPGLWERMPFHPASTTVCVTGANGFIGSYLCRDLLLQGFTVRGTVRDPNNDTKTAHLVQMAQEVGAEDRFSLARGDLLEAGSFDDAIAGCDAVFHTAAAVFFAAKDPQKDIVDPSVQGTRNVLDSARKAGTVKRFVHTSSMVAIYGWNQPKGHVFSETDWNTSSTLEVDPYGVAKVEAEKSAVAYVKDLPEDERFELVHLNPGMVWGPPLIKAHAKASPKLVRDVISRSQPGVPKLMLSVVDVRDVSAAHIAALQSDDPPDRCLVFAENVWMPDAMKQLQQLFPDVKMGVRTIPKPVVLLASLMDENLNTKQLNALVGRDLPMDNARSRAAYGLTYRPLVDTLRDTAAPMINNGWARVKRR